MRKRVLWIVAMAFASAAAYTSRPSPVIAQPIGCGGSCVTSARCTAECWYCVSSAFDEGGGTCSSKQREPE